MLRIVKVFHVGKHKHSNIQEGDLQNLPLSIALYLAYLPASDASWKRVSCPSIHTFFLTLKILKFIINNGDIVNSFLD